MAVRALRRRAAINPDLLALHDQLLRMALSAAHLCVCSIQGVRSFAVIERARVPLADRVTRRAFVVCVGGLELSPMDVLMTFRTVCGRVKEIWRRLSLC